MRHLTYKQWIITIVMAPWQILTGSLLLFFGFLCCVFVLLNRRDLYEAKQLWKEIT